MTGNIIRKPHLIFTQRKKEKSGFCRESIRSMALEEQNSGEKTIREVWMSGGKFCRKGDDKTVQYSQGSMYAVKDVCRCD